MLSKSRITLITSLKQKKYRFQHQLFVVEGIKTIKEFLNSPYELEHLYAMNRFEGISESIQTIVSEVELKKVSFFKNSNSALAIFKMKPVQEIDESKLLVGLDNVRDPGNLGTIIRLCDWFGVTDLICNSETVDCYNPKVVQATMGSLTRVNITYLNLEKFLSEKEVKPVFGTFMEGDDLYSADMNTTSGIVVLGNEANGISEEIEKLVTQKITIPKFGSVQKTESLNVAMATAVILSEFKRKTIVQ
ncbi:MAG: RNA methyltransferase [Flavobacteriaceae bacterium]|nr:RNA methyltransferase [Flavobacteriaceae bacterium]